jgi:hypothetical protein
VPGKMSVGPTFVTSYKWIADKTGRTSANGFVIGGFAISCQRTRTANSTGIDAVSVDASFA